jgi:flavodoxin
MAKLNLVVGSMLGAAEYVADHVANLLEHREVWHSAVRRDLHAHANDAAGAD